MAVKEVFLSAGGADAEAYAKTNQKALIFSHFGIGSGENANPENCEMKEEKYTMPISMKKTMGDGIFKLRGVFSNENLTEDFIYRELALYIKDPKDELKTVLYCYGNAKTAQGDYTETIPAFSGSGNAINRLFDIDVRVSGGAATFVIDDSAKADVATVQEIRDDLTAEIATREEGDAAAKDLANATGVLSIEHGGTGADTDRGAQNKLLSNLDEVTSSITDETYTLGAYQKPGPTSGAIYKRPFSSVWSYIQGKIASVLGLTKDSYTKTVYTTMVDLGFEKDSDVALLDFWKKLITKGYRPAMTVCVGWQDAKKANLVSGDTRINVNGGVMHIGACGSPNVAWQTLQIIYETAEGHTYNITAKVNDTVGELFHESIKEVITSANIGNQTVDSAKTLTETLPISKGGTGGTTSKVAQYNLLKDMEEVTTDLGDDAYITCNYIESSNTKGVIYKRKTSTLWTYIKDKISSVLGLTASNYNGTSAKATNDKDGNDITTTYAKTTVATQTENGLMSSSDKTKLDGMTAYSLPTATSSTLGGVKITKKTGFDSTNSGRNANFEFNSSNVNKILKMGIENLSEAKFQKYTNKTGYPIKVFIAIYENYNGTIRTALNNVQILLPNQTFSDTLQASYNNNFYIVIYSEQITVVTT